MNKKSLFVVLFAMLCLAIFTVSVSADQDGHTNWCNMDQYGCWVTGDGGEQVYIMFWSEEARTYFMGPNSNAVVTDYCADCGGKLGLEENKTPTTVSIAEMKAALLKYYENSKYFREFSNWLETASVSEIVSNYNYYIR